MPLEGNSGRRMKDGPEAIPRVLSGLFLQQSAPFFHSSGPHESYIMGDCVSLLSACGVPQISPTNVGITDTPVVGCPYLWPFCQKVGSKNSCLYISSHKTLAEPWIMVPSPVSSGGRMRLSRIL